jgi:hypothetical protein
MSEIEQSHEPNAVTWQTLRKLGFAGLASMTFALNRSLRSITEAGIRRRHPDYDDRRVRLAATKLAIGPELFKLAYPGKDVEP